MGYLKLSLVKPEVESAEAPSRNAQKAPKLADYVFVLALLLCFWVAGVFWFQQRINTFGACATTSCAKDLAVTSAQYHSRPDKLRLSDSYEEWRTNLFGLDMAGYIETGIEFAHNHGLSVRTTFGNRPALAPSTYHPPLTPFIIGLVIKLFGEQSVYPYFFTICAFQYICAAITVVLAGSFVQTRLGLLGAGMLSLFCWPALEYTFGAGLFSSEAVTYPFFGMSLLALAAYRKSAFKSKLTYALPGLVFGITSAACAYARDAFGAFATLSMAIVALQGLINRKLLFKALTFAMVAFVVMHALENPWEKYMQKITGHRMMSVVGWNGFVFWNWSIWPEASILNVSGDDSCAGVGTFIAPQMQPLVAQAFASDPSTGAAFAAKAYIESFLQHPLKALSFRARYYDCLWFGHRWETLIYAWCLISMLFFCTFAYMHRRHFYHELYTYPIYMLLLSTLIHYDHRFCYAFYVFITPICVAAVTESFVKLNLGKRPR